MVWESRDAKEVGEVFMQKKQCLQTHGGERKCISLKKLIEVQYGCNRKKEGGMVKSEDSRNWN